MQNSGMTTLALGHLTTHVCLTNTRHVSRPKADKAQVQCPNPTYPITKAQLTQRAALGSSVLTVAHCACRGCLGILSGIHGTDIQNTIINGIQVAIQSTGGIHSVRVPVRRVPVSVLSISVVLLSTISVVWTALTVATEGTGRPGGGREGAEVDRAVVVEAGGMRPASSASTAVMASSSVSAIIISVLSSKSSHSFCTRVNSISRACFLSRWDMYTWRLASLASLMALGLKPS